MCQMCQFEYDHDHEATQEHGRVPCPKCGRFYVDRGQKRCYHCFAKGLEPCERCVKGDRRSVPLQ